MMSSQTEEASWENLVGAQARKQAPEDWRKAVGLVQAGHSKKNRPTSITSTLSFYDSDSQQSM